MVDSVLSGGFGVVVVFGIALVLCQVLFRRWLVATFLKIRADYRAKEGVTPEASKDARRAVTKSLNSVLLLTSVLCAWSVYSWIRYGG